MEKFKIIKGHKEKNIEKETLRKNKLKEIYKENYFKASISMNKEKIVYFGIKFINCIDFSINIQKKDINVILTDCCIIDSFVKELTFLDVLNIFPITKDYNGYKYSARDYWSTKEYLKTVDLNEKIGDNIDDFYLEYYNKDIVSFLIRRMLLAQKINPEGQFQLMDNFLNMNNIETYKLDKDKNILIGRTTGKVYKISSKRENKHLKLL